MPNKVKARSAAAAVAGKNGSSLITNEKFRQLYTTLLKYHLLEERLSSGSVDSSNGAQSQAAAAVGVALDLGRDDTVVLTPRSFVTQFVKGVPIREMLHYAHSNGAGGAAFSYPAASVLTPSLHTVSAQLGLATGAALANKLAKNCKIAVAFIEGDAAALDACREGLELASARKLPLLYVIDRGTTKRQAAALEQFGELFPVITVDAHDVVAIYRVAQESIARVREGGGPAMIACMPYRLNEALVHAAVHMERYLSGKSLFRDRWREDAIAEFTREVDAACLPQADPLA
jgi:TPP-dependent pyruvate/acetoin dehydrogenase alpha subunit